MADQLPGRRARTQESWHVRAANSAICVVWYQRERTQCDWRVLVHTGNLVIGKPRKVPA